MDLLYSRYASPLELMNIYLEQGRFGEFVTNIINLENKRIQETAQKENDDRLWLAYVHSMSDKTFSEWKDGLMKQKPPEDYSMTDEQVEDAKQQAKEIMKRISV